MMQKINKQKNDYEVRESYTDMNGLKSIQVNLI